CGDMTIDALQAIPGFARGWNVKQREQHSGHDLKEEDRQRRATEDIEPARGASRHRVLDCRHDRVLYLQPRLEPLSRALHPTQWSLRLPSAEATGPGVPGVGICSARMKSSCRSTL